MNILVTGSGGLVGSALSHALAINGHKVISLGRSKLTETGPYWDPEKGILALDGEKNIDVVIHLAGAPIADGRWTPKKKHQILASRVKGTQLLAEFFARSATRPSLFISASAIGFYGNRGEEILDESSQNGSGFLAEVCKAWEEATAPVKKAGIRVVHIRLGMVLSAAGGALKKMIPAFKLGLGGAIGSGNQFMSWVSLDDVVDMIQFICAESSIRGPVNLVSPNPIRNREFTSTLGKVLHRPTFLTLPAIIARAGLGEMADQLLLASSRVMPAKLIEAGYTFHHPQLRDAFDSFFNQKLER